MELVTSFCIPQKLGGVDVPCTLLVGNYAWSRKKTGTFPFKAFLRQLGKRMRVVVVDEFHTSKCCFFCGQKAGHLQCRDMSDNIGVKKCTKEGCASNGRAMDRDETGVLNIVALFVMVFVGGGYPGGYSWWGWNGSDKPIPDDQVLSLFQAMMGGVDDDVHAEPALPAGRLSGAPGRGGKGGARGGARGRSA